MSYLETLIHNDWHKRPKTPPSRAAVAVTSNATAIEFLVSLGFCMLSIIAFMVIIF